MNSINKKYEEKVKRINSLIPDENNYVQVYTCESGIELAKHELSFYVTVDKFGEMNIPILVDKDHILVCKDENAFEYVIENADIIFSRETIQ